MLRTFVLAVLLIVAGLPVSAGYNEGVAARERGAYKTAVREFKPLAEQGDAKAQFALGVMYNTGLGVPQNLREAAHDPKAAVKNSCA